MFPELTEQEVDYTIEKVLEWDRQRGVSAWTASTGSSSSAWASAGMHHAAAFQANRRFEVAGICDIDQARLEAAAAKLGVAVDGHRRARSWRVAVQPDVFCFCTLPNLRTAADPGGHRERRAADRLREAGRAHQRRGLRDPQTCSTRAA